jgi:hypothetical protein
MPDTIGTEASTESASFQSRMAHYEALVNTMNDRAATIRKGGGAKRIERQHERGKMTARERIEALVDDPDAFKELGLFAGYEMYEDEGGCPAGGTVMGLGHVSERLCLVVANDATVKAGAWFPITAKKNLRAQEIALENHVPIRPHFSQQRQAVEQRHPADCGRHGELRGGRRLPANHERRGPDCRGHRLGLLGGPVSRESRHRRGCGERRAGRRHDAL